ncbi:hypothetical protein BC829DRAFT_408395, partial [Chytridium lagenaria]
MENFKTTKKNGHRRLRNMKKRYKKKIQQTEKRIGKTLKTQRYRQCFSRFILECQKLRGWMTQKKQEKKERV